MKKQRISSKERITRLFGENAFAFYQALPKYEQLKYRTYLGVTKNPRDIYTWSYERDLMPFKEIGKQLGITEKNASLIYRNALKKLRILLKERENANTNN